MKSKPPGKKRGRKGGKHRANFTIGEKLYVAAEYLGAQTFGNTSNYLEHLILNDLREQGMTVEQIAAFAAARMRKGETPPAPESKD